MQRLPRQLLLVWSLFAVSGIAVLFGLATKVWQLLLIRAALGGVQCLGLLPNIILGDLIPAEHRPQAFAWIGSANFAGATVGALLGGVLALPKGRIPILGDWWVFQVKPYALPGMAMSLLSVLGVLAVLIYVPEVSAFDS